MSRICVAVLIATAIMVAGAAAQTTYMKAAPSSEPAKSAPAQDAKKKPITTTKCQAPGSGKPATC